MNARSLALLPFLLAGTAPLHAQESAPAAAAAQPEAEEPLDEEDEEEQGEAIVVTGQRLRGSVDSDIPPEVQLNRRDIRATGAGNLSELLDAIAPQTRSGRGRGDGGPVLLLNGRRISGFSEIRDIPPEAIERVDILPEEVALRYGYRAEQRVVNIVLRERFRAVTAELEQGFPTAGGRGMFEADVDYLRINRVGRINLSAEASRETPLLESERDIIRASDPNATFDPRDFRTLMAGRDRLSLNGTVSRALFGDVATTFNARFDASATEALLGRDPGSGRALTRETDSTTGHLGFTMNGEVRPWRWSLTGNFDRTASETVTAADRADSVSQIANSEAVASGPIVRLPAGPLSATLRAGIEARGLESESNRGGVRSLRDLSRERGNVQASLDLPIASRRREVLAPIGNLSINLNGELDHLSDFGTLRTIGYGLAWSPLVGVDFGASRTHEEGAPTMQQLGDPLLLTPGVRVFDFVRGETVDISRLEGGSPNLSSDDRRVTNLRLSLRPFGETDLSLTANYTASVTESPIASFPTATPEIEAAFRDRFVRDGQGRLVQIDARPVNFLRSEREEMRWGVNFSAPLGPEPPPGAFGPGRRGQGAGPGGQRPEGTRQQPPGGGEGQRRGGGGGGRGFGGPGGGGGMFGGGRGGRLQLGLFHTWRFTDQVVIRDEVAPLDFLNGSAAGNRGGRPRHEVELQAGAFRNGLGARLTANWQSGTFVRGAAQPGGGSSSDLSFSDVATVNLRLFADLGQQRSLVRNNRWLRGTRVSLLVDNLFDSRPGVTDASGATPLSYQPDYLDPLGRTVRLSIRKLFF